MDKQKNLTIEHRSYLCHPETCCHKEHYSFWVLEDGNYIRGFDTESEAKSFIKTLVDKEVEVTELEREWLEMNQQHEQAVNECFEVNAENRKLQAKVEEANAKAQMCRDEKNHAINRWSAVCKERDELQKQKSLQEMEINHLAQANQQWQLKCQELQKRVDDALKQSQSALQYVEEDMRGNHEFLKMAMIRVFKDLEQALKGETE